MIPIRYNRYAGHGIIVGGAVGLAFGLLLYYALGIRTDDALDWGFFAGLAVAGVTDLVIRVRNLRSEGDGPGAIVGSGSGGHIWYVPLWIIGFVGAAAILFGKQPRFRPIEHSRAPIHARAASRVCTLDRNKILSRLG